MNINGENIDMTGFNKEFKAIAINTFSQIIEAYNLKVVDDTDEEIDGMCSLHLLNEKANYKLTIGFNLLHGPMLRYADLTKTKRDHAICRLDFCLHAIHNSAPNDTMADHSNRVDEPIGQISPMVRNLLTHMAIDLLHYGKNILEGDVNAHEKIVKINREFFAERDAIKDWERRKAKQEK